MVSLNKGFYIDYIALGIYQEESAKTGKATVRWSFLDNEIRNAYRVLAKIRVQNWNDGELLAQKEMDKYSPAPADTSETPE